MRRLWQTHKLERRAPMSRFADARAAGTYTPGTMGATRSVTPAEMVAAMSAWSGPTRSGANGQPQKPALLYDADGHELSYESFRSPFDGGPGFPIQPRLTDPGRPPRETQGVPGWNLIVTPRGEGGMPLFSELRALALACWQYRVAVDYRKKKTRGKKWEIVPVGDKTPKARKAAQADIDRVTAFWRNPNRKDPGTRFGEWVAQAVEEIEITDALVFYKYPDKIGKLYALVQIDGATIKPLIDEFQHVVGYQQILWGYPATQYPTYDPTTKTAIVRSAAELDGRLAYIVTNPSVTNVYGSSTLEQLRPIINLAIRRTIRQLSWYTDGTVPDSFIESPDGYTVNQIKELQSLYRDVYSGNDALRAGMTVLPHGANYLPAKPFQFSKDESEEIVSIICADKGIPRSIFTSQTNRATAEVQGDDAIDIGQKPQDGVLKDFIDEITQGDLEAPDLEFTWIDTKTGDELKAAQAKQLSVGGVAWVTVDELRADDGREPMPEAEKPEAKAAKMAEIMAAHKPEPGVPSKKPTGDEAAVAPNEKAVGDELAEWRRFALKRVEKSKHTAAFECAAIGTTLQRFVEAGLKKAACADDVRAVFEKAAGIAAKRRAHEKAMTAAVGAMFTHQKDALLRHAKNVLPAVEVAAA